MILPHHIRPSTHMNEARARLRVWKRCCEFEIESQGYNYMNLIANWKHNY